MKLLFALSTLLTFALASPIANAEGPGKGLGPKCFCEPPICPMELIAECRCKNAAALNCYESFAAKGVKCPKPVPQVCGAYNVVA